MTMVVCCTPLFCLSPKWGYWFLQTIFFVTKYLIEYPFVSLCMTTIKNNSAFYVIIQGFFQQFWEKGPGQNWEKMITLTSKLGEINDIE